MYVLDLLLGYSLYLNRWWVVYGMRLAWGLNPAPSGLEQMTTYKFSYTVSCC